MNKQELAAIVGRRVRQAREMRGMSLRALADAMKGSLSHTALANFESGKAFPDSTMLIGLGRALGVSTDYFARPFTVELKGVRFRKKASLGLKNAKAIQERAREFLERYREAEERTGEVRAFVRPDLGTIADGKSVENATDKLRAAWGLGEDPVPNVHELLEEKGVKVMELEGAADDFDGLCADSDVGPVIVIADWLRNNLARKRLSAVHELGHVVLRIPEGMDSKTEEALVMRFAGAFLMPQKTFTEAFGRKRTGISVGELIALKARFGASCMAIMKRAEQLGLISRYTYEQFFIFANRNNWRTKEPGNDEYRGDETSCRFKQLVLRGVAEEQITSTKGAALLGLSLEEFRKEFREVAG